MATLATKSVVAALAALAFSGCGNLAGTDTASATPLAQIHFQVTGDVASVQRADTIGQTPQLRVALVWGAQALPESFCVLPPESSSAAEVIAAGCPDIFRFVPNRAGADIAIQPNVPTTIDLLELPGADVMVGDITARIAYGSLVLYDDRNGNGALDFRHPHRHHDEGYDPGTPATRDIPYGASFISMTQPDQRVAFREGAFNPTVAFYPRFGCQPDPPVSFSILSAGGFSQSDALLAVLQGQLPAEDPASCGVGQLDSTVVTIPLRPPTTELAELSCTVNDTSGAPSYQQPPAAAPTPTPDLSGATWACVSLPKLSGESGAASGLQLVFASAPSEPCQYVAHYILRGCDNDPTCSTPSWDLTANPPTWWPSACLPTP